MVQYDRINLIAGGIRAAMYKRIAKSFSILVAVCILVISVNGKGMAAAAFKDVPDKYSSEVYFLVERQIITGYPDGTFKPKADVSRDEAVTMVGRAIGLNGENRQTSFKDVKKESFASGYIQSALESKIILNTNDSFRPKEKMTRGEMALALVNAFKLTDTSSATFSDISSDGPLAHAIDLIVTSGIANGYPDGTFKPENPITRAEFSLLIARGLEPSYRVSSTDMTPTGERVVTADELNVRSGPGTEFDVVEVLPHGAQVLTYFERGDWQYITYNGVAGYVHKAYLLDMNAPNVPDTQKIIAIDAGHGGKDPGAMANGLQEKEVTLAIALKVQHILEQKGIQVVMTRKDDTYLTLDERVKVAQNAKADTFVSIHINSNNSSIPNGTETYYSKASLNSRAENSKQLATFIQDRLYKAIGTTDRKVKEGQFYVIHKNPLPSVLIETGFVSNAEDAMKLASEEYRNLAAEAISLGILDYYQWKK